MSLYRHAQDHRLLTRDILGYPSVFGDILGEHLISNVHDEPADKYVADTQILCDSNFNVASETGIGYPTLQAMLKNIVVRNQDGCAFKTFGCVEWESELYWGVTSTQCYPWAMTFSQNEPSGYSKLYLIKHIHCWISWDIPFLPYCARIVALFFHLTPSAWRMPPTCLWRTNGTHALSCFSSACQCWVLEMGGCPKTTPGCVASMKTRPIWSFSAPLRSSSCQQLGSWIMPPPSWTSSPLLGCSDLDPVRRPL